MSTPEARSDSPATPPASRSVGSSISSPWARRALITGLGLTLVYLVLSAFVFRMALGTHRKEAKSTPTNDGLVAESVHFNSAQNGPSLNGWYVPSDGDRAIVVLHGLDSQSWNRYSRRMTEVLHAYHYAVLLFDFRGQGKSEGERLGLGWDERQDVRAAVDLLLSKGFKPGQIGLNGTSYGAATSLLSAAMIPEVGAVVADSPFADMRDLMSKELKTRVGVSSMFIPGVTLMGRLWMGVDLADIAPLKALAQIAPRPILFTHGEGDSRIPFEHSQRLKAASQNPNDELWLVPGAEHCKQWEEAPDEYYSHVLTFWEKYLPTQKRMAPLPVPPLAMEPGPALADGKRLTITLPPEYVVAADSAPASDISTAESSAPTDGAGSEAADAASKSAPATVSAPATAPAPLSTSPSHL